MTPKQGPGQFQWNTGGWFGAQFGSTLWMFLLAASLFSQSTQAGMWVGFCALVPNVLGCILWLKRGKIAPYLALQVLIGSMGAFALVAVLATDHFVGLAFVQEGWSARRIYGILGIFPAMMVWFALMERAGVKRNKAKDAQSTALTNP